MDDRRGPGDGAVATALVDPEGRREGGVGLEVDLLIAQRPGPILDEPDHGAAETLAPERRRKVQLLELAAAWEGVELGHAHATDHRLPV